MPAKIDETKMDKEFKRFMDALTRFQLLSHKAMGELLREFSNPFAANLVYYTTPFANRLPKQQELVRRNIRKIYRTPKDLYEKAKAESEDFAKSVYAKLKDGDIRGARRMVNRLGLEEELEQWDTGAKHKMAKPGLNQRGRLKNVKPQVQPNDKDVRTYIKKVQDRTGYTKSGWTRGLPPKGGGRGIPAWVRKQSGPGRVVDNTSHRQPAIIFENHVPWIKRNLSVSGVLSAFRKLSGAIERKAEKMEEKAASETISKL